MITVEATVRCDTKGCKSSVKVPMVRGYEDGEWNVSGLPGLLSDKHTIVELLKWELDSNRYFGQRESWSGATCPKCLAKAKAEADRPKSVEERLAALEGKRASV